MRVSNWRQNFHFKLDSTIFRHCIVQISIFQYIGISRMHAHWRACNFWFIYAHCLFVFMDPFTNGWWDTPLHHLQDIGCLFCKDVKLLSLYCSKWLQRSVFGPRRWWRPRYGAVSDPTVCLWYCLRRQRVGLPDECGELVAKQLPRWHLFTDLSSFKQISIHKSFK